VLQHDGAREERERETHLLLLQRQQARPTRAILAGPEASSMLMSLVPEGRFFLPLLPDTLAGDS